MSGSKQQNNRHCMTLFSASFCFVLGYSAPGFAKPDMQSLGPNIADKGSKYYHFRVNDFDSADGERHYRVWTAVPNKIAPPSGYPVLYMLDGNAVMDRLPESLLKQLAEYSPPVIVAVGYQTTLPFDLNGRAYDYTPVLESVSPGNENNPHYRRRTGGGNKFRQLLETRIAPQVEKGLVINPARRGIWGHSYGGLFILDAWMSSSYFQIYYSSSPSFGGDNYSPLTRITGARSSQFSSKRLAIMEGAATPGTNPETHATEVLTKIHATLTILKDKGVNATFWDFPGQGHGPMFTASFHSALLDISSDNAISKPDGN